MGKVLIQVGKAVSLNEVGRQIGYVGEMIGLNIVLNRGDLTFYSFKKLFESVIFIYPCSPTWALSWFNRYRTAKLELRGRALFYTTIDGVIKRPLIPAWVTRDVEVITCSNYVKEKVSKAGIKVIDVIHHGVLDEEAKKTNNLVNKYSELISASFKDKVIFGYVGDSVFRKGVDKLLNAVTELAKKRDDFHLLLVTRREILPLIEKTPHTSLVSDFGIRTHVEILSFFKSIDYLVFPSMAEGFGLPVAEANYMGTVAIINNLPVYHEYADMKFNIVFNYNNINYVDTKDGFLYEIHNYDVNELVNAMNQAIEIKKNYPSEYEDRKVKVQEKAQKLRSEELYKKFYKYLGYKCS